MPDCLSLFIEQEIRAERPNIYKPASNMGNYKIAVSRWAVKHEIRFNSFGRELTRRLDSNWASNRKSDTFGLVMDFVLR